MSNRKQTILVGIDLGTSVSSAAFLLPGKNVQPMPVSGWPGADDVKSLVVPFCVQNHLSTHTAENTDNDWGYYIKSEGADALLLKFGEHLQIRGDINILNELRKKEGSKRYQSDLPTSHGRSILRFIAATRKHIETKISLTFGKDIIQYTYYKLCFAVPPWWNADAVAAFTKLVHDDGLNDFEIIFWPTASLAYFLGKGRNHPLQQGDVLSCFHTEEMITTVSTCVVLETTPTLRFNEPICQVLTIGSNDVLHSFGDLIADRLQNSLKSYSHDPGAIRAELSKLESAFEKFIFKFDGTKDYKFRLPWSCPDDPRSGVVGGAMTIDASTLRSSIFKPVLGPLCDAIENGVPSSQQRTHILFSGILSECPYVSKFLEQCISDKGFKDKLQVLKAVNGYTSGSRGAALHLDKARKKVTLQPLSPCSDLVVRCPLVSSMSLLAQSEKKLEELSSSTPADNEEVEYLIHAYEELLTKRIHLSGLQPSTLHTFDSLLAIYVRLKRTADILVLRARFKTLFMEQQVLDPTESLPSELLFLVAMFGTSEILQFILDSGSSLQEVCVDGPARFKHYTALHFSVHSANIPLIEWLLSKGADTCAKTAEGQTSLHVALSQHHNSPVIGNVVQLLAAATTAVGDHLNLEDNSGVTALDQAEAAGLKDVASLLRLHGGKNNSQTEELKLQAIAAAESGDAVLLQRLLHNNLNFLGPITSDKRTLLHIAAVNGRDLAITSLISAGIDPDITSLKGETALHLACRQGHEGTVLSLLNLKANVTIQDATGDAALHIATKKNHLAILKHLLQFGAKPDSSSVGGWTALHLAAEIGSDSVAKVLINNGAVLQSQSDRSYGWTEYERRHAQGHAHSLVLRKTKHPDDDIACGGWTPLHVAAHCGHDAVLKMLIKSGADVNTTDIQGCTPLQRAALNGHENIVAILLKSKAVPNSHDSRRASTSGAARSRLVVSSFFGRRGDNFGQDNSGRTVLHDAAETGQESLVKLLLKKGINPNTQSFDTGWTALSLAVKKGFPAIVKLLMKHGANPNVPHKDGSTALHLAAGNGNLETVALLLTNASVKARDHVGNTPLHEAVLRNQLPIVQILLKRGAEINTVNGQKLTPLLVSASMRNFPVSEYLIKNGADPDIANEFGMTVLHIAVENSDHQLFEFLAPRHVNFNAVNVHGRTPLHIAAASGNHDKFRQLLGISVRYQQYSDCVAKALIIAIAYGQLAIVQTIIEQSPPHIMSQLPNRWSKWLWVENDKLSRGIEHEGWTPLHLASWLGHAEIARALVNKGADPNAISQQGWTPLQWIALASKWSQGHIATADFLLERGADPMNKEIKQSVVYLAATTGHGALIESVLKQQARTDNIISTIDSSLRAAAANGHFRAATLLLDAGADMHALGEDGSNAIHKAVSAGHIDILRLLADKGGDVTSATISGSMALHLAASAGDDESVKYLLQRGANRKSKTLNGLTPLDLAAQKGHLGIISLLLDGTISLEEQTTNKWMAIYYASMERQQAAARILFEKAGGLENDGSEILHWAVQEGSLDVFKMLIDIGAEIKIPDAKGWSPLHKAVSCNQTGIIEYILSRGVEVDGRGGSLDRTPLHEASAMNRARAVAVLTQKGANPTARDKNGDTPLHLTAKSGYVDVMRHLLEACTEISIKNLKSQTPIALAASKNHHDILRLLLMKEASFGDGRESELHIAVKAGAANLIRQLVDNGAQINCRDSKQHSPLCLAVIKKDLKVAKILLEHGANTETPGRLGITVLRRAASKQYRSLPMLKLLIDHGANVNVATGSGGLTALIDAAATGGTEVVELLINSGANISARLGTTGDTALHLAAAGGHDETIRLLLERGIDINMENHKLKTPLHKAVEYGHLSTTTLLLTRGANLSHQHEKMADALSSTASKGDPTILRAILDHGTPLVTCKAILQLLLKKLPAATSFSDDFLWYLMDITMDYQLEAHAISISKRFSDALLLRRVRFALQDGRESELGLLLEEFPTMMGFLDPTTELPRVPKEISRSSTRTLLLQPHGNSLSAALEAACKRNSMSDVELLITHPSMNTKTSDVWTHAIECAASGIHTNILSLVLDRAPADGFVRECMLREIRHSIKIVLHENASIIFTMYLVKYSVLGVWNDMQWDDEWLLEFYLSVRPSYASDVAQKTGQSVLHFLLSEWDKVSVLKLVFGAEKVNIEAAFNKTDGDNPSNIGIRGDTPLIRATRMGTKEITELLLDRGADIHAKDITGDTSLHIAAEMGDVSIVKLLLRKGANSSTLNANGKKAADLAAMQGSEQAVNILRKHERHTFRT